MLAIGMSLVVKPELLLLDEPLLGLSPMMQKRPLFRCHLQLEERLRDHGADDRAIRTARAPRSFTGDMS